MKRKHPITIIRRSCLTGKAVWIYQGKSKAAARIAYWRACKREIERVRNWGERAARRMSNIARLMADCMAEIPVNAELSPRQTEAARQLQTIQKTGIACHRDFYEHIMEEQRRRREDREIRRKMREREMKENRRYDK